MSSTAPVFPDFPQISDEQITAALTSSHLDPDFGGFEDYNFESALGEVIKTMRDANLFGAYNVYLALDHDAGEGTTSGGQVLVSVPNGPTVAGPYQELRHLTSDRAATGIAGYVAIADVLAGDAELAVANLRSWVTGVPAAL